jgi:hypothetical protein
MRREGEAPEGEPRVAARPSADSRSAQRLIITVRHLTSSGHRSQGLFSVGQVRVPGCQRASSQVRADREVYTTQVVVNGSVHALGGDREAIEAAFTASRKNGATLSVPVAMTVSGGRVLINLGAARASVAALCPRLRAAPGGRGRHRSRASGPRRRPAHFDFPAPRERSSIC